MSTPAYCSRCGQPRTDLVSPCTRCGQPGPGATPAMYPGTAAATPGYSTAPGGVPYTPTSAPGVPAFSSPAGSPSTGSVIPKGFLKSLYDANFDSLVTPRLIKFFYILYVALWSLSGAIYLIFSLAVAAKEPVFILVAVIVVPLWYLVGLIWMRVIFELIAAFFRLVEDLRAIRISKGV